MATADDTTTVSSIASFADSTEFGVPVFASAAYPRYGWLGTQERSADALGGLILMGVRLYNPLTGCFLQTDPIPGGSANPYDYANQDPVNQFDLDGRWGFHWRSVLTFTVVAAGVIGAVACGVSVVCGVAVGIAAGAAAYAAENAGTSNWSWTGFGVAAVVGVLLSVPVAPEATAGRAVYHSGAGMVVKATPASSSVWSRFKAYRGKFRTNGKSGKERRYYRWDYTHGDIEVFDSRGKHIGSADPHTGSICKPRVNGRTME